MRNSPATEDEEILCPLESLIRKSEKAQQKLAPKTWQHAMLQKNLRALHCAYAFLNEEAVSATPDELKDALAAFASMIGKTENSLVKSAPGTPSHTLLKNRLRALREAEARIASEREKGA